MNIVEIEGVGPVMQAKLRAIHITTTDELLVAGRTPGGRERLAASTGISTSTLLEWINHADLMRINGIGPEYADLLEETGVDTVPELARRNPEHLHARMEAANTEKQAVRRLPSHGAVEDWIVEAKRLGRTIEY